MKTLQVDALLLTMILYRKKNKNQQRMILSCTGSYEEIDIYDEEEKYEGLLKKLFNSQILDMLEILKANIN